ncbi:MAG: FKBP-type peptidyl-prolyl cis-trans isomerase [Bacteroidota bacterium]
MKKTILIASMAVFAITATAQKRKKDKTEETPTVVAQGPQNGMDSLSYAFGVTMANNLKNQGVETLSFEQYLNAVKDVYSNSGKMTTEQAQAYLKEFIAKKQAAENEANKQAGIAFLEQNKNKPGVTVLPSGLQYKILNKGTGTVKPTLTDKVKTHYHGTLIDGTVFDSSVDRGQPLSFNVNGVIRGWVEILQTMVAGDKFEIYVPYDLAYGSRGTGKIKPFSTLIFTVELIDIEKP